MTAAVLIDLGDPLAAYRSTAPLAVCRTFQQDRPCLCGFSGHMIIRHLELDDLDALLELYAHLHAADSAAPDRSTVESVWRELIENPTYRCYGGFLHGELICSCIVTIIPNLTRGCRPYGVIENVVTHAQHRRHGFGKAVLRRALDDAWSAGCYKVMLLTGRKDEGTFRFYESVGFDRNEKQAFIAKPAA